MLESEADSEQSEDLGEKEKSNLPCTESFGLTPSDQNIFELWIQKLKESDLDFHFFKKSVILDIWSLVEVVSTGAQKNISFGKISRRQFAELVSLVLFRSQVVWLKGSKLVSKYREKVDSSDDAELPNKPRSIAKS